MKYLDVWEVNDHIESQGHHTQLNIGFERSTLRVFLNNTGATTSVSVSVVEKYIFLNMYYYYYLNLNTKFTKYLVP